MRESTERQLTWHKEEWTSKRLKVIDTESEGAQWNAYLETPYPNGVEHSDGSWWREGEGWRYPSVVLEQWYAPRGERKNKHHICQSPVMETSQN